MCQFEYKGKKIKLLPSRPKIRQPEQKPIAPKNTKGINLISVKIFDQKLKKWAHPSPSLALLPIPPVLPPITTTPSFSPTGLASSSHESLHQHLPLLLPTPTHYRVSKSASVFVSHVHKLHKKSMIDLNGATLTINYELISGRNLNFLILAIMWWFGFIQNGFLVNC